MHKLIFFSFLFAGSSTLAAGNVSLKGGAFRVEPIVGYETLYRDTPTPHTTTRTIVGGRLVVGSDGISGELEYTKGSDTENFSTAPQKVYNDDEKGKLGLRSTYRLNEYIFASARVGGQGSRGYTEETSNGELTRVEKKIQYHPYAGASLGIRFGSFVSISAGTTVVFKSNGDMNKNDVQNTLSISLGVN